MSCSENFLSNSREDVLSSVKPTLMRPNKNSHSDLSRQLDAHKPTAGLDPKRAISYFFGASTCFQLLETVRVYKITNIKCYESVFSNERRGVYLSHKVLTEAFIRSAQFIQLSLCENYDFIIMIWVLLNIIMVCY